MKFIIIFSYVAAMGGLLGLGLGISFISVIELFYFLFYRRIFLWLRSNWSTQREPQDQTIVPRHSFGTSSKYRKISPPSSPTINPSSSNIWFLSLDGHSQLVRRGSVNLPSQIKSRVLKYWRFSRISRFLIKNSKWNLSSNVNILFCKRRTKTKYKRNFLIKYLTQCRFRHFLKEHMKWKHTLAEESRNSHFCFHFTLPLSPRESYAFEWLQNIPKTTCTFELLEGAEREKNVHSVFPAL